MAGSSGSAHCGGTRAASSQRPHAPCRNFPRAVRLRVYGHPVSLVPRNALCPCGSGRKYKRCCIEREADLARRADAVEVLVGLPGLFPLLRPADAVFEAWAAAHATESPSEALIAEGVALLAAAERERIEGSHARAFRAVWDGLVADVGSEAEARELLVAGAVAAALREGRTLEPASLAVLERTPRLRESPHVALSVVLAGSELWSVIEAASAADAVWRADDPDELAEEIRDAAAELATPAHVRRLELLVERVRAQLPAPRFPAASAALAQACEAFVADRDVRAGLAALLLGQAVGAYRSLARAA
jgi:SEC-C motif